MADAKKPKGYMSLPEMRLFWVFLGLIIVGGAALFLNVSLPGKLIGVGIFVAAAVVMFVNSKKTARSTFEMLGEKSLLNSVIAGLEGPVIASDLDFKILVFNIAAEKLFGIPSDEVVGKVFSVEMATKEEKYRLLGQLIFPSLAPQIIKKSVAGSYPQVVDVLFSDPFAEYRVVTTPILNEDSVIIGSIKVIHDRTRDANLLKSKNEFITVASHQLRTPLTAINWVFQETQRENIEVAEIKSLVTTGAKAAAKLSKTVNDILDLAKMEEGRFGYTYQPIDLVEFTEKIVNEASAAAKQFKIKVYFEKPAERVVAPIDTAKLAVVFSNLIDNAIKYNVENGDVIIRIKRVENESFVQVSVSDSGMGIPKEDLSKIFGKFFRAEQTVKINTEGSGLGLYLAKNIIIQHGGKVWAESEVDRGTTIYFTLPTDIKLVPQKEIPLFEEEG